MAGTSPTLNPLRLSGTTDNGQRTTNHRRGFTLIELLVVIVIIAILVSLLVVAAGSVIARARTQEVVTEISGLENGIANFDNIYGRQPPSRIVLCEIGTATGGTSSWASTNAEIVRSRAIIRSLWPQFNFAIDRNLNDDTDSTDTITLTGAECLVFFLGGMSTDPFSSGAFAPIGFSKNPTNPFSTVGTNREGPFLEFDIGRFRDLDGDGMPEYLDPLSGQQWPYVYASSNEGRGYDEDDLHVLPESTMTPEVGNLDAVYMQTATKPWNSKSFQIISAGVDGAVVSPGGAVGPYGTGGVYNEDTVDTALAGAREAERDNITNFKSGTLAGD